MFPFNQFAVRRLIRVMLAVIIILLVSACRRQVAEVEPTAVPTFTATPRSTPLPAIATSIPAGQEENPLKMYISPVENMSIARSAASALEAALLKNDLFVQIELVEQDAQLLTALCASSSESAAVAWVSGAAYLAVEAENCGHALLQIKKGKDGDATTATASSIIARRGINSYDALDGRTFCRINYSDSATWLIPSLMLRANG
ncbi:MAG: hypothetical protein R3E39_04905, partial [Anaerolineae bacterium]